MKDMASLIREKRKEAGLTQKELAEKLGVTDKAVSKWERGFSCPDTACIKPLSELFGISADELLSAREASPEKKELSAGRIIKITGFALCVASVTLGVLKATNAEETAVLLGISLLCLWIDKLLIKKESM